MQFTERLLALAFIGPCMACIGSGVLDQGDTRVAHDVAPVGFSEDGPSTLELGTGDLGARPSTATQDSDGWWADLVQEASATRDFGKESLSME